MILQPNHYAISESEAYSVLGLDTTKFAGPPATRKEAGSTQSSSSRTLASATTAPHSHEKNEIIHATAPTKPTKLAAGEIAIAYAPRAGDATATDAIDATQGHAKYAKHAQISLTSMKMVLLWSKQLDRS